MTEKTTGVRLLAGRRTEFTVSNLNFTTSAPTYDVEIHFNSEEPFDFVMNDDGESYTTRGEDVDLAEYFGVELTESTLDPPSIVFQDGETVTPPEEEQPPEEEVPPEEEPPQQKYSISYDYTQGGGGTGTSWSIVPSLTEAAAGEVTIRFIVSYGVSLGKVDLYTTVSGTEQTLIPIKISDSEYSLTFTMPAEEIALTVKFTME